MSVDVSSNVNIWTNGIYAVNYTVTDSKGLSARAVRNVTVKPEPEQPVPAEAPKITVNGSNPIVLHQTSGTPYKEQGARAVDYDGADISGLVTVSGYVNREVAGVYTLTYSIVSPKSGMKSETTRNVRIIKPNETRDARVSYGLSGQAKQGGIVTHMGIVSNVKGFMDFRITEMDKNMTIAVKLVDVATKKTVMSDTFTAAGTKQYNILDGRYDLTVGVTKANGNSKYAIELLMPEAVSFTFNEDEIPVSFPLTSIAPIGSNPIILHLGGTPYFEQGARAVDFKGDDIAAELIEIIGVPDTSTDGIYIVTYRVYDDVMRMFATAEREVRVLAPDEFGEFAEDEVPLPTVHVVKAGETLASIAFRLYGNSERWRDIYEYNKEEIGPKPNKLTEGLELQLKREWYENDLP